LAAAASTKLEDFAYHDEDGSVQTFPEAHVPMQEGAVFLFTDVQRPDWQPPNLAHVVAFMEPGPVFGMPVVHILRNLSTMTRNTVDCFADCF
jgi:hypothetical protein